MIDWIWFLIGIAIPGVIYYFLTKPPIEKAVKYTLWFAGIGFGVGIAVGIVASALSWLPLFGQLISITLVLALGVNLLISWIINKYLPIQDT